MQVKQDKPRRRAARRLFIRLLAACLPHPREPRCPERPASILLLCPEKLGDCILFTPLVHELRRQLPDAAIHMACFSRASARFFSYEQAVCRIWRPRHATGETLRGLARMCFDVVFCPKDNPSWTFLLWTLLVRSRCKIGLSIPLHRKFFHRLAPVAEDAHILDKNLALLDMLGLDNKVERPALPAAPVREEIAAFVASIEGRGVVGFNLSAGEADREWPLERWRELTAALGRPFVTLCMPDRAEDKRKLEQLPGAIVSPDTRSVFEAAAIVGGLAVFVTPDTSLLHAAAAVQTPVAGLYRYDPFHHLRFAPRGVSNRQLISPTFRVADIPVDDVLAAVRELEEE